MKTPCLFIAGLLLLTPLTRAADPNPAADAEWADIQKNSKPPAPPAEWNTKPPTPEQMVEFKKKAGDAAEKLANRTKKFYETYPDHPNAQTARTKEKNFRQQAVALRTVKEDKPAESAPKFDPDLDPAFKEKFFEAMTRVRAARAQGPPAVAAEMEKSGRELAKEFPKQTEPWEMLFMSAQYGEPAKALAIYKEVAANAPEGRIKQSAADQLKTLDRLNKPLALAYKSVDGRDIDISKMTGKVVLVDFWATWCGPCVAEMPRVKKTYEELHDQGFEIVGVSFDQDCDDLKKFVAKHQIPWAQSCDGGGWQTALNKEFAIHSIPTMYLVDKKGILRDMNARENLADKVKALLKE